MSSSIRHRVDVARTMMGAGVFRVERPDRAIRAVRTLRAWGSSAGVAYRIAAIRNPDRVAIVDERGTLTFAEVDARTNALARALRAQGIGERDTVALMCRNHRGFVETHVACAKLGASVVYLNTAFAGPQLADVVRREQATGIVYDAEFGELLDEGTRELQRFVSWWDPADDRGVGGTSSRPQDPMVEELIAGEDPAPLQPPAERGRVVILTSGTTGAPKGAKRKQPDSLEPAAALFSRIPLRSRETTVIAAPMFHSWGYAHFSIGLVLASTLVLRRRFDPEQTLADVARHRATTLAVVPVMLQRILELPAETIARYDTSSLRVIAASGSALPGELATRLMDTFGDVLYNLYGSTEVAWATIATPADLRAAPGTAGRPPLGTVVKLLDEGGREVPPGTRGRIFAGNEVAFEGYTGGGGKEIVGGLLSTGDTGHLDAAGRLFVDGREDEMIVSGGENVFPREVEDLLASHAQIEEAAVIGVKDSQFGQRLKAFVVARSEADLSEEAIKEYVKQNLARYKVPREVVFMDALPRNATGKVLKRELAAAGE